MTSHPDHLAELSAAGVAVWLDDISRERLTSGNLAALVRDRHVVGVTSNPTIFDHALSHGSAYKEQLGELALRGVSVGEASRDITAYDVRWACDVLRPVHDATGGVDGRVSLEVDPRLANDTAKTVAEARALWWLVDRPNLFIKIPATRAGLPAITQCLAEGISVNVTLIFSLERYGGVIDAFFTMYVVELVAPGVVNTMPESTIMAVADHGELRGDTIRGTYAQSRKVFDDLAGLGISYDDVVTVLENEGVTKFAASWQELLETIETEMKRE